MQPNKQIWSRPPGFSSSVFRIYEVTRGPKKVAVFQIHGDLRAILDQFSSLLPCHTLSHISGPPKARHTSRTPLPIFSSACIHTYVSTRGVCLSLRRFLAEEVLSIPLLSEYIHYNR